jgi:hypothetical protein
LPKSYRYQAQRSRRVDLGSETVIDMFLLLIVLGG